MCCVRYNHFHNLTIDDVLLEKILHTDNLPKHKPSYDLLLPILGKTSLVTAYGETWRKLRKMFNPAFANSHLEKLIPGIIEESMLFIETLEHAIRTEEIVKLNDHLTVL